MEKIGFSSNALITSQPSTISRLTIQRCRTLSDTIECHIPGYYHMSLISAWVFKIFFINQGFKNISVSLPSDIVYRSLTYPRQGKKQLGVKTKLALFEIEKFISGQDIKYCLVNPDYVANWEVFNNFPGTIATKNTNQKLNTAKKVDAFFQKHPNIFFVWDIAKWPNSEILDKEFIKWNLVGIHLSDKESKPIHLAKTEEVDFLISSIHRYAGSSVPIILTGELKNKKEMEKEFAFVLKNI